MLDEMTNQNTWKFAILIEYENQSNLSCRSTISHLMTNVFN